MSADWTQKSVIGHTTFKGREVYGGVKVNTEINTILKNQDIVWLINSSRIKCYGVPVMQHKEKMETQDQINGQCHGWSPKQSLRNT